MGLATHSLAKESAHSVPGRPVSGQTLSRLLFPSTEEDADVPSDPVEAPPAAARATSGRGVASATRIYRAERRDDRRPGSIQRDQVQAVLPKLPPQSASRAGWRQLNHGITNHRRPVGGGCGNRSWARTPAVRARRRPTLTAASFRLSTRCRTSPRPHPHRRARARSLDHLLVRLPARRR